MVLAYCYPICGWLAGASREIDLTAGTIKLALVTDQYEYDPAHEVFADVSAYELSDASYTAGGVQVGGRTWSYAGGIATLSGTDTVFPLLAGTFMRGILYWDAVVGSRTKPLIGVVEFNYVDFVLENVVVDGSENFTVVWTNGVVKVSTEPY